MTERDLAKELLQLEFADGDSVVSASEMTRRILIKDRRRVRIFAWVAGLCWIAAIGALYWSTISILSKHRDVLEGSAADVDPRLTDLFQAVFVTQASVEALVFALLATLLLVFFSQRATLRQVNSNLMEIATQLKGNANANLS